MASRTNGVWCATGTGLHEAIICEAAAHSKHIAVEKPVAASPAEIQRCYEACAQTGVELYCSYQRRFDKAYRALKAHCDADLGTIASIHAVFRDHPMPPMEFLVCNAAGGRGNPWWEGGGGEGYAQDMVSTGLARSPYCHGAWLGPPLS